MSSDSLDMAAIIWPIINGAQYALPSLVTWWLLMASWPRSALVRTVLAILVAWAISVLFTAYVLNPVGHAYLVATRGEEYAFNRFDNNTIASSMLGGWMIPLVTAVFYFVAMHLFRRFYWTRSKHNRASGVSGTRQPPAR